MLVTLQEVEEDRAWIEENLLDRGRVTREAIEGEAEYVEQVFDTETGQYPGQGRVVVYEGRCRVQVRADINSNAVEAVVGAHEWTYRTSTVQFPIDPDPDLGDVGDPALILPDNELEILTSPLDSQRVGTFLNLQADNKSKTLATCRRFRGKELLS